MRIVVSWLAAVLVWPVGAGAAPREAPDRPSPVTRTSAGEYSPPVEPLVVLRPFSAPLTTYGPGHRGVDLRRPDGAVVRAAGDAVVLFAGQVAGRGVVVLAHADGLSTEYEPVAPLVHRGATVRLGDPIGRIAGRHRGCPVACLHWGARRGSLYLDPLMLLRPLGPVRLLPWPRDG